MVRSATARSDDVVVFGPFALTRSERLLTRDGAPLHLGARALDLLIALVARANEVVGKRDLLAEVWPDTFVDEGSLRFQVAGLRQALGDGRGGARYIQTVPGRGYCFVAPVSRSAAAADGCEEGGERPARTNLPARPLRLVGRADDAAALADRLTSARFVTLVGSGGIGKTTLAVAVGHDLAPRFAGAVVFVDLGALSDPGLVATTIASLLGLSVQSGDPAPGLIAHLRDRRMLLILDTCEHLADAVAALAERIFRAAPLVHILATSREALRAGGEHVLPLEPLACPPDDAAPGAACIGAYPAAELFLERAQAAGARLAASDAEAAIVAAICRKLGGVALAIELAAGRVAAYGLEQTASLLDQRLALLWPGQRTAPPRQRSLQAALDWSYGLLGEAERRVLRQLSVFVGHFTIEAALEVVAEAGLDTEAIFAAFDSLVARSMVAVRPVGAMMRYRLLDTTRAFVLQIPVAGLDTAALAARHAGYYRRWLEQTGSRWLTLSDAAGRALHLAGLNNVRAALEWCFGPGGDAATGVELARAAAPVLLSMSLLPEAQRWCERALAALGGTDRGGTDRGGADRGGADRGGAAEIPLQAALGVSLMFTSGGSDAAGAALRRGLAIAGERGTAAEQMQLLGPLNMFHLRSGDFHAALDCAQRCAEIAATARDPAATALANAILGISLHLGGALADARVVLEAALVDHRQGPPSTTVHLGFESRILAGAILARTLWLQGHVAEAATRARLTVRDAARMDHPLTLAIALIWAISVLLWIGDLADAERCTDRLIACAEPHALAPYLLVGHGFRGELAIRRGDAGRGVARLAGVLTELRAAPYELLTTSFGLALIQGLADTGRGPEAAAMADEAIRRVEASGEACYLPELLRLRGGLHLTTPTAEDEAAEACFLRALQISRRQGARSWALRTGVDYARLLLRRGRRDQALALLRPIAGQVAGGWESADGAAAGKLLAAIGG